MPVHTRRWDEPAGRDEGLRLLVMRYRPRGVSKADETWNEWWPHLGPSRELHAAVYGKIGEGIPWTTYRNRYRTEMLSQRENIQALARRVAAGETITLLCSSACLRESRCHRSLLREMIEAEVARMQNPLPEV